MNAFLSVFVSSHIHQASILEWLYLAIFKQNIVEILLSQPCMMTTPSKTNLPTKMHPHSPKQPLKTIATQKSLHSTSQISSLKDRRQVKIN